MPSICCTVTNDLTYDQRMYRICTTLSEAGYDVVLIGRERRHSKPLRERAYQQVRLRCYFDKGKLFYLEYNFRLLLYLWRQRYDVHCAIDLDSMLPHFLVARSRRKPLVYDAHEYFTEMEEVVSRPLVHRAWRLLARWTVPKVTTGYTVSEGYARLFRENYGVELDIIRNATVLRPLPEPGPQRGYVLYQGAVNVGRGLPETFRAMPQVQGSLLVIGKGDVYDELHRLRETLGLAEKVEFKGFVEPVDLPPLTAGARAGLTLFAREGLSNAYSLANRFFDYFHHGVPQVAMNYPEYRAFNERYEVAILIDDLQPETIATALNRLLTDDELHARLRANCLAAREAVNWQGEAKRLQEIYTRLLAPDS